jgi:hypothetical protein
MPSIPSIAGYESGSPFDKCFWKHVEKDAVTGLPIRGSLGIDYGVHVNLDELASGPGLSQGSFQKFFKKDTTNHKASKKVSAIQAKVIIDFYNFVKGDQPYFFLRKGKTCIGLCRKTGGYLYWPHSETIKNPDFLHRFSFEFVRAATAAEQAEITALGAVPATLVWVSMTKEAMPVPEIDTRAELRRLSEDMKGITALLTSIQTRLENLTA